MAPTPSCVRGIPEAVVPLSLESSMKRVCVPLIALLLLVPASATTQDVGEKKLLDNDRVAVYEFVFPPGFKGEEHAAVADEFAYVLDGEFTVVTRGRGKRTLGPGDVEYATKGTLHYSLNESGKRSRVLVVLLK